MYEVKHVALKPYNILKKFNFKVIHPTVHHKKKKKNGIIIRTPMTQLNTLIFFNAATHIYLVRSTSWYI
jgi:hypothetical protein